MLIQSISIRLPEIGSSNLKFSKFLPSHFFSTVFLVFLFFVVPINMFLKKQWNAVLEKSCLNRWFSYVSFKITILGDLEPKISNDIGFIFVFAAILNDVKYLWRDTVFTEIARFYIPVISKIVITFCNT